MSNVIYPDVWQEEDKFLRIAARVIETDWNDPEAVLAFSEYFSEDEHDR